MRQRYPADMPTPALLPLVITAGVLALVMLWPRVRSGVATPRRSAELALTTRAVFALL